MVAEYEHIYYDGIMMSPEARELSVSQNKIFFSEKDLGDLEALLVNNGSTSNYVQTGGGLEES